MIATLPDDVAAKVRSKYPSKMAVNLIRHFNRPMAFDEVFSLIRTHGAEIVCCHRDARRRTPRKVVQLRLNESVQLFQNPQGLWDFRGREGQAFAALHTRKAKSTNAKGRAGNVEYLRVPLRTDFAIGSPSYLSMYEKTNTNSMADLGASGVIAHTWRSAHAHGSLWLEVQVGNVVGWIKQAQFIKCGLVEIVQ